MIGTNIVMHLLLNLIPRESIICIASISEMKLSKFQFKFYLKIYILLVVVIYNAGHFVSGVVKSSKAATHMN